MSKFDATTATTAQAGTASTAQAGTASTAPTGTTNDHPAGYPETVARDVDFDGSVDVIHSSNAAGGAVITHVDEAGQVTLVEEDSDGNGTFETVYAPQGDGTALVGEDRDDDGSIDVVAHYDATGQPERVDVLEDGLVVESTFDTDGDGRPDTLIADTDRDGVVDTIAVDTDGDGYVDTVSADTDGDGAPDTVYVDRDGDGVVDFEVTPDADSHGPGIESMSYGADSGYTGYETGGGASSASYADSSYADSTDAGCY
ncbi:hypothetical protein [Rhodococcus triatomae]